MKSWIRINFDEDQELLKCITLGPAIKEYVDTLSYRDLMEFLFQFERLFCDIWHEPIEGDDEI